MADPLVVLDHRDPRVLGDEAHEPFASARDDQIDETRQAQQSARSPPDRRRGRSAPHRRGDPLRRALRGAPLRAPRWSCAASEPPRKRTALPLLMHSAAASMVTFGRDLVDHADDAERNAHLAHQEPVGPAGHAGDRAHRIVRRGDLFDRPRHGLDARSVSVSRSMNAAVAASLARSRQRRRGWRRAAGPLCRSRLAMARSALPFSTIGSGELARGVTRLLGEPPDALCDIDRTHGATLALPASSFTGCGAGVGLVGQLVFGRGPRRLAMLGPAAGGRDQGDPRQNQDHRAIGPRPRLARSLRGAASARSRAVTRALVVDHANVANVVELRRRKRCHAQAPKRPQHGRRERVRNRQARATRGLDDLRERGAEAARPG